MGQKYATDMRAAAHRHYDAAEKLYASRHRQDVAGYLVGIAAECALKKMMLNSGMRPLPDSKRRDDPFFAHFDVLKTLLRDTAEGRLRRELMSFANNDSFMQRWDISMRYSHGRDIDPRWVDKWFEDAKSVLEVIDS